MENLTARGLICHKVTAEAVTVMVALDHIFQCGMGWPFGCTDLHGVSKGERRRRLVRQGEPGRGCACKRVAKSRHIESERIEDLLRCDPARGN